MKQKTILCKIAALFAVFALVAAGVFISIPAKSANASGVTLPGGVSSDELAAYWKFDETTGNKASDSSGNGRHLNLMNGSTAQWKENGPSESSRSFKFNGSSAFLMFGGGDFNETETGGNYWITTDFHADGKTARTEDDASLTISYFVQIDDIVYNKTAPEANGFNLMFGNEGLAVGVAGSIEGSILNAQHFAETGNLDVSTYDPEFDDNWLFCGVKGTGGIMGGTDKVVAPDNVNNKFGGEWTMVTYVIDDSFERGTNTITLYLNGTEIKSETLSLTEGTAKSLGNQFNAFCVGGWKGETPGQVGANRGFYGSMSEFMVFTRALSSSEISDLAAGYGTEVETPTISIALNKTVVSSLKVGKTEQLTATILPASIENKAVTWTTSDAAVATVDNNGKVTAVAAGAVTITATSVADNTKHASCAINVVADTSGGDTSGGGCGSVAVQAGGGSLFLAVLILAGTFIIFRKRKADNA